MKILIIDDDKLIRITMKSALSKAGYDVIEAATGQEGVSMFFEHNPSLIVTDMLIPDKEGTEIITELKAKQPDIRIIAISGGGSSNDMTFLDKAKEMGADLVLNKPFRPAEILGAVETLIQGLEQP